MSPAEAIFHYAKQAALLLCRASLSLSKHRACHFEQKIEFNIGRKSEISYFKWGDRTYFLCTRSSTILVFYLIYTGSALEAAS